MRKAVMSCLAVLSCLSLAPAGRAAVTIEYVPVGNPGNSPDPATGFGSVAQLYFIGKHEVTNSQYAEFLNAKAASDPVGLYNLSMASDARGGIIRSGSTGSRTYAVKAGQGNQPVVFVNWYSSIRFANWLNNGQGAGDTENGAYTLAGGSVIPSNDRTIARNAGAAVFLPSENEWYKAAHHQPSIAGGDGDGYWLYPTGTNAEPNSDQPPGDPSIQTNAANFFRDDGLANGFNDGYAVTASTSLSASTNYLTDVGAYAVADSFYGTFDQGGNVFEWNEDRASESESPRGVRGGMWNSTSDVLGAGLNFYEEPGTERSTIGFRVASIPEPASGLALLSGGSLMLIRRRTTGGV